MATNRSQLRPGHVLTTHTRCGGASIGPRLLAPAVRIAVAILAMSGQAAAFTPVPIRTPRTGHAVAAPVGHDQAHAITRLEE